MDIQCKASLAFVNYEVSKKVTFGEKTVSCLQDEATTFPNLPYPVADLKKTNEQLKADELAAMSGDKVALEKRDASNAEWNNMFRQTANYVSLIANGNAEMIKSTNFNTTKTTRHRQPKIETVENFKAVVENEKGAAYASCKSAKGARGYVFIAMSGGVRMGRIGDDLLFEMGSEQVRLKMGTLNKAQFTGLPSEQRISLSSIAFNAAGSSAATDVQSIFVQ